MDSICITFYSKTGVTRDLINALSKVLIERGYVVSMHRITALKEYSRPLHLNPRLWRDALSNAEIPIEVVPPIDESKCDVIIIAAPIWIGRIAPPARSFIMKLRGFRGKVVLIVTSRFGRYCSKASKELESIGLKATCFDVIDRYVLRDARVIALRIAKLLLNKFSSG